MLTKKQTKKKRKPYTTSKTILMSSLHKLLNKITATLSSSTSQEQLFNHRYNYILDRKTDKSKPLAFNLVHTLMNLLYVTFIVSLSTYPISVSAVGKYIFG